MTVVCFQQSFEIQSNTPHADFCSAGVLRKEIENITTNSSLLPSDFFHISDRAKILQHINFD